MNEIPEMKCETNEMEVLNAAVGNKEKTKLSGARVKIIDVLTQKIKISSKLVCVCKHPDRKEAVSISEIKYEKNGKLEETGIWINLDEDKKIMKGSALAVLLAATKSPTAAELKGKEIDTVLDTNGYLCFKCY